MPTTLSGKRPVFYFGNRAESNTPPSGTPGSPATPEPAASNPETPASSGPRSAQDEAIANLITGTEQLIGVLTDDSTVRGGLSKKSFDTQKIETGTALCAALDKAYQKRQSCMAQQLETGAQVKTAYAEERALFIDYRETMRTVYAEASDRTALSLAGRVPEDLQKFVTFARARLHGRQGGEIQGRDEQVRIRPGGPG